MLEYRMEPSLTIGGLVGEPSMWQERKTKSLCPSLQDRRTVTQRLGNQNIHRVMMMMSIIQGDLSSNNEDDDD